jgi:hypothetical protein
MKQSRRIKLFDARQDEDYSLENLIERLEEWDKECERHGDFVGSTSEVRDLCQGILDDGNPESIFLDGTLESAAKSIMNLFSQADGLLSEGNAEAAARVAFNAGRSFELMRLKFSFEEAAIRGLLIKRGAARGGAIRASAKKISSDKVLSTMRDLLNDKNGMTVSNAAGIAFTKGFGASAEANRKLWTRRAK